MRREDIRVTKRSQTFSFDAPAKPALVNVDAEKALLAVKNDQHTEEEWAFMYRNAPLFLDRQEAFDHLQTRSSKLAKQVWQEALQDKHSSIRQEALAKADLEEPAVEALVTKMATSDPEPGVRAAAIQALGATGKDTYTPIFEKGMQPDQPYSVLGASLEALSNINTEAAIAAARNLQDDENDGIVLALGDLYSANPTPEALPWFRKHAEKMDNMGAFRFYDQYARFLMGLKDQAVLDQAVSGFQSVALDKGASLWRRFANAKSIADLRNFYREGANKAKADELSAMLAEIREKETDATLKLYYGMFDQP